MRLFLFIILFPLLLFKSFGQKTYAKSNISLEVEEIIDEIKNTTRVFLVDCPYNMDHHDYDNYKLLESKATTKELIELTNHPKRNIRCYSFFILSKKEDVSLFPFLLEHFDDTACMYSINSCHVWVGHFPCYTVSDFYIDVATGNGYKNSKKIDSSQTAFIDSLLIYSPVRKFSF